MFKNEEALNDVRRKVAEKLNKDGNKLVFGWQKHRGGVQNVVNQ